MSGEYILIFPFLRESIESIEGGGEVDSKSIVKMPLNFLSLCIFINNFNSILIELLTLGKIFFSEEIVHRFLGGSDFYQFSGGHIHMHTYTYTNQKP